MLDVVSIFAQAAPAGGQAANPLALFFPFIMVFGIMYFLIWRPQSKQRKELQSLVDNLKKGDKVVTAGGILGQVAGIQDEYVVLKVGGSDTTKIEILKTSITGVREK